MYQILEEAALERPKGDGGLHGTGGKQGDPEQRARGIFVE